jgi:hypothetical protein
MTGLHVHANLDCEATWAGAPLPAAVRAKLVGLGTLVRAVVPDGATALLALPPAFDRERIADPIGAPAWRIATAADRDRPRLVWGADGAAHVAVAPADPGWRARLAAITPPALAILRVVADRRWARAVGARIGAELPGAVAATTVAEVEAAIAAPALRDATGAHAWIAKAAISAAGRDRVRRRGPLDDATRARLARLAARGGLVVEPWVERLVDVGQPGLIDATGVTLLPAHRLFTDPGGGFAGIAIVGPGAAALGLTEDEHAQLRAVAAAVGAALADAGYRGPFTIDAFAWRAQTGERRFQPLCELNPRLTFGLVARAWAERRGGAVALHLGAALPPGAIEPLLRPAPDDPTAAWLAPIA